MVSAETIKEIIRSNEDFILREIGAVVAREGLCLPSGTRKVGVIYGVRRSGKTFLLYDLFKKHATGALYIDFEDERIRDIRLGDLERIKDAFFELKPQLLGKDKCLFLFDEIQNVPGWEKFARRMVEKERIGIFVAGSSSKITPRQLHTSLRGRAWSIALYPFSFPEFLRLKGIDPSRPIYGKGRVLVKSWFMQYLKWGGFPEIGFSESDFERTKILGEYLDAMFFKDLVERFNITNIHLLEALKESLFSSFSGKFSLASFYKQYKGKFPFSKDMLYSYYRYFTESMLVSEVRLYSPSAYRRMRNPPKVYLVDPGLGRKLGTQDLGRRLENLVFIELKRKGYELHYFEERNECDFVVKEDANTRRAIQVSWELNQDNREREINGLCQCCRSLGLKHGTIITSDQESEERIDGIAVRAIPFWKWVTQASP